MLVSPPLASRPVFLILITVMVCLGMGHLILVLLSRALGSGDLVGLRSLFNLNEERNLPTYFSSLLLLANAGMLLILAADARREGAAAARNARY